MKSHRSVLKKLSGAFGVKFIEEVKSRLLSTGIPALDMVLGGVWTEGSIIELYGETGSGKSAILDKIAGVSKDMMIAFFDCDHSGWSLDSTRKDNLIYCRPRSLAEMGDMCCAMIKEIGAKVILIDAVNALPNTEGSEEWNAPAIRKVIGDISGVAAVHGAFVAVTSQVRSDLGSIVSASKGLSAHAPTQVFLERLGQVRRVKEVGCRVRATVISRNGKEQCEFELTTPRRRT